MVYLSFHRLPRPLFRRWAGGRGRRQLQLRHDEATIPPYQPSNPRPLLRGLHRGWVEVGEEERAALNSVGSERDNTTPPLPAPRNTWYSLHPTAAAAEPRRDQQQREMNTGPEAIPDVVRLSPQQPSRTWLSHDPLRPCRAGTSHRPPRPPPPASPHPPLDVLSSLLSAAAAARARAARNSPR